MKESIEIQCAECGKELGKIQDVIYQRWNNTTIIRVGGPTCECWAIMGGEMEAANSEADDFKQEMYKAERALHSKDRALTSLLTLLFGYPANPDGTNGSWSKITPRHVLKLCRRIKSICKDYPKLEKVFSKGDIELSIDLNQIPESESLADRIRKAKN